MDTIPLRLCSLLTALACGLLFACGGTEVVRESPQGVASPEATSTPPAPSSETDVSRWARMIDVGEGRKLYVECAGKGSPTVLLEAGDNSDSGGWAPVSGPLSEQTRTCAYDRAGLGRSDPASGCRQLDDLLDDTEAVMSAAGIRPPYVLVGTSGGGFLMAGLAARHPDQVAGLVLLETPKAITILTPEVRRLISCDAPENVEHRDYRAVEHAVWDHRARLGTFPMRVVSNDYGNAAPPGDEKTNVEDQRGWLVLSPRSKQVVVTSGHDVIRNETAVSLRAIRDVLRQAG